MEDSQRLRISTHMLPGYPVELFQLYQRYLEESLSVECLLMVESRPYFKAVDVFASGDADIGFISSSDFIEAQRVKHENIELLGLAPMFIHSMTDQRPVYFSEVVISAEKKDKIRKFEDLTGHIWAYSSEESLSGSITILSELKRLGYNSSFFGNKIPTGNHHNSLELVLTNKADVTSVDSNVLELYFMRHPEFRKKLHILQSLGPLPMPPIVVNSRLPKSTKERITQALLDVQKSVKWQEEFSKYRICGFKSIDSSLYDSEKEIVNGAKGISVHAVYY